MTMPLVGTLMEVLSVSVFQGLVEMAETAIILVCLHTARYQLAIIQCHVMLYFVIQVLMSAMMVVTTVNSFALTLLGLTCVLVNLVTF